MANIMNKIDFANGTLTLACEPCTGDRKCLACDFFKETIADMCYIGDDGDEADDILITNRDAVPVGELKRGELFMLGKTRYMVLEQRGGRETFAVADELVATLPLDKKNSNDWRESSLRAYLNGEFLDNLIDELDDENAIVSMEVDLTADDGLKEYGSCIDKVALLTMQQYRQHRDIITNKPSWWWTLTAYSTKSNGYSSYARFVFTDGESEELTKEINEVRFRESSEVDGQLIAKVKQGRDGASVELADKQKSLAFLERYFELNPMDKHRKEYDKARLEMERRKQGDCEEMEDDGFIEALNSSAKEVWDDENKGDVPI